MDTNTAITILSFTIGVLGGGISSALAAARWYAEQARNKERVRADNQLKEYAAQRDFNHLRNSQEQLSQAIKQLSDEMEMVTIRLMKIEVSILNGLAIKEEKN